MRLYGNDIDETTTVLEAGLGWIVGWNKPAFIGAERGCASRRRAGRRRDSSSGFEMIDRGIARHGYPVVDDGERPVGVVTSGTQTPFLKKAIGMAYVPVDVAVAGHRRSTIDIRGRASKARVVPLPFYKRRGQSRVPSLSLEHMAYPADLKYTKDHEWIRVAGDTAEVGITDYAQQQLGDVVYVELPEVGRTLTAGESFGIDRVGEGGLGAVRARERRGRRGERRAEGSSRDGQQRAARDLDDQGCKLSRPAGARRRCSTAASTRALARA